MAGRITHAPDYVRAVHPGHGEPVLYTPGELFPAWVAEALDGGAELVAADDGILELRPAREAPPAGRKTAPKETT